MSKEKNEPKNESAINTQSVIQKSDNSTLKIVILVSIIFVVLCCCLCVGLSALASFSSSSRRDSNPNTSLNTQTPTQTLKMGESASANGFDITVEDVIEHNETSRSFQPRSGYRYIAVKVNVENTATATKSISNFTDFEVMDKSGRTYSTSFRGKASPELRVISLRSNDSTSGYVTFEVEKSVEIDELIFSYSPVYPSNIKVNWQLN